MKLVKGKVARYILSLIYGTGGVGKSTLCNIPGAVFVDVEDGLFNIDCDRTPHIKSLLSLTTALRLLKENPDYQTIVIDSLDAVEKLFVAHICKENKADSLSDLAFGRGYDLLNNQWQEFLDELDRIKKKKNVILIGHDVIKRHEDPRFDGYDRILLKVHQKSAGTIVSRCDAVLYMTYEITVVKNDNGMHKDKAVGQGKRIIFTNERPAFVAKNRFSMPDQLKGKDINKIFNFIIKKEEVVDV